jgi:DNA-directed RNA polymerase specialized sigma24 family protein
MATMPQIHPTSEAVLATLREEVAAMLFWYGRDLDASVEADDVVQELALAQLEAQAATASPTETALRHAVQRRVRREVWQVRWARGKAHRAEWDEQTEQLVGSDTGLTEAEEIGWNDVVRILGWERGLTFWLSVMEDWQLGEIAEWQTLTKQQVWHRVRTARKRLRRQLGVQEW